MTLLVIDVTVTDPDSGEIGIGSATVVVNDTPLAAEKFAENHHTLGARLPDFAERARQIWGQVR